MLDSQIKMGLLEATIWFYIKHNYKDAENTIESLTEHVSNVKVLRKIGTTRKWLLSIKGRG